MKILFVCRGNVGRSQIAEGLFNKMAAERGVAHNATSAGTKLSGPEQPLYELGDAIEHVVTVMKEEGVDISRCTRNQVTKEMVDEADRVVLVVDENDPIPEYLTDNPKVTRWDVLDPKGQSLEFTREVRDQIKGHIKSFEGI